MFNLKTPVGNYNLYAHVFIRARSPFPHLNTRGGIGEFKTVKQTQDSRKFV